MRILHAIWFMGLGGAEQQLVQLSEGLVKRGHEVHVVTSRAAQLDDELRASGASLEIMNVTKRDPRAFTRLLAAVRRTRPHVINTWLPPMDIIGTAVALVTRTPFVVAERSSAACYPPALLHRLRVAAGRRAAAIVANSVAGLDYWRGLDVAAERLAFVPNIVPAAAIAAAPLLAREEDVAAGQDVVLFVGRLAPVKNIDRIIDAAAIAMRSRAFHLVICGDGPLRAQLEARAGAAGIGDRVHFLGAVTNAWSWMKRAAVLVALSTFEGNPNVVQEAIAAGLPLILSELDAYRSVAADDSALFTGGAPDDVAAAIVATLDDRDAARLRAERAARTTRAWARDDIAAEYEALYLRTVGQRRTS
jgi:glycosyltransferase involved in cell wall biosynthesis